MAGASLAQRLLAISRLKTVCPAGPGPPTLDLARITVDEKVVPAARNLGEWLADRYWPFYTPLFKIARFLLRKQISHAEAQRVLIDGDAFRKAKRYMIYRFRVPD